MPGPVNGNCGARNRRLVRDNVKGVPASELTLCAEAGDAGPVLTSLSLWSYSVVLVLLALVPVALMVRNLGLARRARGAKRSDAALHRGPAVLEGKVDHPGEPPLRVAISQRGIQIQYGHGPGPVEWTESARSIRAEPFRLLLASGREVEVIPDERAQLLLELDRTEHESELSRLRVAEVGDGERIFVSGRLELTSVVDPSAGGYRGATVEKAVLRPAGAGGMLVSRKPLERVFLGPIRKYAAALAVVVVALAAVHTLYFGYHARVRAGVQGAAEVVDKRIEVDSEGGEHEKLDLVTASGTRVTMSPTIACYRRVEKGDRIPALEARWGGHHWQAGHQPSLNLGLVMMSFVIVVAAFIAYVVLLYTSRRWYAGRLLDE